MQALHRHEAAAGTRACSPGPAPVAQSHTPAALPHICHASGVCGPHAHGTQRILNHCRFQRGKNRERGSPSSNACNGGTHVQSCTCTLQTAPLRSAPPRLACCLTAQWRPAAAPPPRPSYSGEPALCSAPAGVARSKVSWAHVCSVQAVATCAPALCVVHLRALGWQQGSNASMGSAGAQHSSAGGQGRHRVCLCARR